MKIEGLRSGYDEVGGIVFFARILDKIRLQAKGKLSEDYNCGQGLDQHVWTKKGVNVHISYWIC